MRKSALFDALFDCNANRFVVDDEKESFSEENGHHHHHHHHQTKSENNNLIKTQTTFENFCVEHLKNKSNSNHPTSSNKKSAISTNGVYAMNANYYFVDRSPYNFEDILHFLRNYPSVSASQFIDRYYSMHHLFVPSTTTTTADADLHSKQFGRKQLLKLQDEANFYKIHALSSAIQGIYSHIRIVCT